MSEFIYGIKVGLKLSVEKVEFFTVILKPNAFSEFESTHAVTINDEAIQSKSRWLELYIPTEKIKQLPSEQRTYIKLLNGCSAFIALAMCGACIWILSLLIRVFHSVYKTRFFEEKNLGRLNRMGWLLIIVEVSSALSYYLGTLALEQIIDLNNYCFDYSKMFSTNAIIGVVVLIMTEFIRMTATMKEEQDFTV